MKMYIDGDHNIQAGRDIVINNAVSELSASRTNGLAHCVRCHIVQAIDAKECRHCGFGIDEHWEALLNYFDSMSKIARVHKAASIVVIAMFVSTFVLLMGTFNFYVAPLFLVAGVFLIASFPVYLALTSAKEKLTANIRNSKFYKQKDELNTDLKVMDKFEELLSVHFGENQQ